MAATASSSSQIEIEIAEPLSEIVSPVPTSALPVHYQVFLNHRGLDVKETLASHIYHTLDRLGVHVFLDKDEMERGELMMAQIEAAISSSSVHIAIFSQKYAESSWCLDELCLMMQHPEKMLPVFYNVQPSDLRRVEKDGPYAEAIRVQESKRRCDSQTIGKWKESLIAVADISGYELKEFNGDEGELVKNIVDNVLRRVKREQWDVAKYPVRLNELAENFEKTMLQMNSGANENGVNVDGIVGMGGLGKTTLATHIFNMKRSNYEKSCFLPDVRSSNSLTDLQSFLLKELTGVDERILSVSQGIGMLRNRLSSCHAFVILDDIDNEKQLDALLVVGEVLPPGSRIVVASRDKGLLKRSGISRLYAIQKLSNQLARELFCWHAFGKSFPAEGFEDLVESFLKVCDGLPLSLKVLGALLYGYDDKVYWRCQLDKVSLRMEAGIKERLKISYDALKENDKEIFLDIAFFFIGEEKQTAIRIWEECGLHGFIGLVTLEQRCLVELDDRGCIRMHDHLRDLGRNIIDDEAWKYPQKPRRLWRPEDIDNLLKQQSGTVVVIRGIKMLGARRMGHGRMQPLRRLWRCFSFERRHSLIGVRGLKLLDIEGDPVKGILGSASRDVRWLRWRGCPYRSLPSWLSMENLTVLELDEWSRCQTLWHGSRQFPAQLRELNVRCGLSRCPKSIGDLKHLEKIVLENGHMKSLPEEFCRLRSLKVLELHDCWNLKVLPENFGELANLRRLVLRDCAELRTLPRSFGALIYLCSVRLFRCRSLIIPTDILGNISTLEYILIYQCSDNVRVLPSQITHQTSLRSMRLAFTGLKELPDDIGELSTLKDLWLEASLTRLPPSIWSLTNLTTLSLFDCRQLKSLPHFDMRRSSGVEHFRGGIQQLRNLEWLRIIGCPLVEVMPFTNVRTVDEEESTVALTEPGGRFPNLREISLQNTQICKISITEDVCPNLKFLDLSRNPNLVRIEALPNTLKTLYIDRCMEIEEVPNVGGFSALEVVYARRCPKLKRIEGSEQLKRCRIYLEDQSPFLSLNRSRFDLLKREIFCENEY